MKVAISGSNGFIGSKLSEALISCGMEVVKLTRSDFARDDQSFLQRISGCDAVINLAGTSIMKRWTEKYKKKILFSRIATTSKITNAIQLLAQKPTVFISASATGIYDTKGEHSEWQYSLSNDFLAEVCSRWEKEALTISGECRTVIVRFGVVLDKHKGALARMLPLFRMGLGGRIGKGYQGFSWIHIDDLINAFMFVIENKHISGPVNIVSPNHTDNRTFTKMLAKTLHRPAIFVIPQFIMRLLYGKGAIVVTSGQRVLPGVLNKNGFIFKYPHLKEALNDLLK